MKKRILIIGLIVLMMVGVFVGCSNQSAAPSEEPEEQQPEAVEEPEELQEPEEVVEEEPAEPIKIGVCAADLSNPYFIKLIQGIEDRAQEIGGIELIVTDPKQDPSKQIAAVENFISLDVDGIIMIAFQPESIESYLETAMGKGIKVLAQSTLVENCDVYASAKDADMGYALGLAAGKYIKESLGGEAEVAILNYPDIPQIIEREEGIEKGILELAPNANIVGTAKAGTPEEGMSATETLLQTFKDINVICAINDAGALGAYNAVEAAGKADGDFFIGGVDAIEQALEKIAEGGIYRATVDTDPYNNGIMDIDLMLKLISGEQVDAEVQVEVKAVSYEDLA